DPDGAESAPVSRRSGRNRPRPPCRLPRQVRGPAVSPARHPGHARARARWYPDWQSRPGPPMHEPPGATRRRRSVAPSPNLLCDRLESGLELRNDLIEVTALRHERWCENQGIAERARNEAPSEEVLQQPPADERLFREGCFGRPVFDELDTDHEAFAAYLTHEWVVGHCGAHFLLEIGAELRNALDNTLFIHDLQGRERRGCPDGVSGIGISVAEEASLCGLRLDHSPDFRRHEADGHRKVAAGHALRGGHEIGLQIEALTAPIRAEPAEPRDHLIEHEQDVMTAKHRHDLLEVTLRRGNQAPRPHDRLGEECSDRVRTLALNELLELAREMAGELPLGHAGRRLPVMMGASGVQDGTERHIEQRVHSG